VSLREGFDRVDSAGHNLVNLKRFGFRLTGDTIFDSDFEASMMVYSATEQFNPW
jgi:hypothetical protein